MKKQIFAVCDTEAEYARNFMDYLNRKKNMPFEVQAFTSAESLIAFAGKNHIELLLISAEAMCREIQEMDIGKVVILTEGVQPPELSGYAGVYKYQASSQVVREVMARYGEEKAVLPLQSPALKKETEILGIYSPLGRCLKTSFALTLGQILAKEKTVLYLNLEEYSGFEELFGQSFPGTLSDLLYFVRQGENSLSVKISGIVQNAGTLDFIPPVQSPLDIRGTPWQDWACLIQEIVLHTSYEVLILDIGNGIDEVFQLLDMCRTVYMPVRSDKISVCKILQFEKLLQLLDYSQILSKTVKMKLPFYSGIQQGDFRAEQLVWSELGDYVREMVRKGQV